MAMWPRVLALLLALWVAGCSGAGKVSPPRPGAGCEHLAAHATCGVLFIGNSITYFGDLPGVFQELAKSGGIDVSTGQQAMAGARLANTLASPELDPKLRGSTWNVVVLQEQTATSSVDDLRESKMFPASERSSN
jgi:hypothetical protein